MVEVPNGIASDLSKLILYPEKEPNLLIMDKIAGIEMSGFITNSRISSAYNAILWTLSPTITPCTSCCDLITSARGSSARANSSGDRGQPCRVLLCIVKGGDWTPLVMTQADGEL